jgi:hypothetical protein
MSQLRVNTITNAGGTGSTYAPGHVVQVVHASNATGSGTTSASFLDTGLTATITPRMASSKILILTSQAHFAARDAVIEVYMDVALLRTSTILTQVRLGYSAVGRGAYRQSLQMSAFNWVDSPNTTSPVTYKTQHRSFESVSINSSSSHITLMEIAQ